MPLFAATILVSAFLLFQVQPLIARVILPWFGGTPAVWTTCMLFFQVVLLAGYAYAHVLSSRLAPRRQAMVHACLLIASALVLVWQAVSWTAPMIPGPGLRPPDSLLPVPRIVGILALTVGLPYLTLSTTGPLLQAWFARVHPGRSAYRLYALSNAGSLLALLTYPFAIEPAFALRTQGHIWAALFAAFAVGALAIAARLARDPKATDAAPAQAASPTPDDASPGAGIWALWIALSAAASVMLLAITNQLSQEVAVVPFLWVLPLALYLLSFILCFESDRWYTRARFLPLLVLASFAVAVVLYGTTVLNLVGQISVFLLMLFASAMVCHGELVRLRPGPRHLTAFYLAVSAGGAVGGLLVGLVAPVFFKGYWELHAGIGLVWILVLGVLLRDRRSALYGRHFRLARAALAVGFVATVLPIGTHATGTQGALDVSRGFYGVLKLVEEFERDPLARRYALLHGQITHGMQYAAEERRREPTTYYGRHSGVGLALLHHPRGPAGSEVGPGLRVGVVGLGVGTLAAYGGPRDYLRFYEINPEVVRLAQGAGGYFTYLRDSRAKVDVVLGDARISLERELKGSGAQRFDVLVVDAFSSDSIPVHLVTREAFELYRAHLAPDGILAVHVSNRFLALEPVVWGLAQAVGLSCASVASGGTARERADVVFLDAADWMLLTRDAALFDAPEIAKGITGRTPLAAGRLWTDDYSALLSALKRPH